MKKQQIITWILFFLIFFSLSQFFNKKKEPPPQPVSGAAPLVITPKKESFSVGEEVIFTIRNQSAKAVTLLSSCPKNPFRVLSWKTEKFEEIFAETELNCAELAPDLVIPPNEEKSLSYTYWNHSLFGNPGRYKIEIPFEGKNYASAEFMVEPAGFWRTLFRTTFYQPLYNVLVFFISIAPAGDLGLAIILLTLLIRLILLVPSQRAMVSQRRMQELQPKLEHVKKTYAGNQERIAQETMKIWKEHKVNPFGSCLPILIQFPVLIALFYVIQNGLNPDNIHLLYDPLKNVDLVNIHTNFLGILELTRVNVFVLPLIVGALQFLQLKLAMLKRAKPEEEKKPASEMESANKMMMYIMPVMIAVFTASVPAGVGLYWGVSTVFALGQQMVANRKSNS